MVRTTYRTHSDAQWKTRCEPVGGTRFSPSAVYMPDTTLRLRWIGPCDARVTDTRALKPKRQYIGENQETLTVVVTTTTVSSDSEEILYELKGCQGTHVLPLVLQGSVRWNGVYNTVWWWPTLVIDGTRIKGVLTDTHTISEFKERGVDLGSSFHHLTEDLLTHIQLGYRTAVRMGQGTRGNVSPLATFRRFCHRLARCSFPSQFPSNALTYYDDTFDVPRETQCWNLLAEFFHSPDLTLHAPRHGCIPVWTLPFEQSDDTPFGLRTLLDAMYFALEARFQQRGRYQTAAFVAERGDVVVYVRIQVGGGQRLSSIDALLPNDYVDQVQRLPEWQLEFVVPGQDRIVLDRSVFWRHQILMLTELLHNTHAFAPLSTWNVDVYYMHSNAYQRGDWEQWIVNQLASPTPHALEKWIQNGWIQPNQERLTKCPFCRYDVLANEMCVTCDEFRKRRRESASNVGWLCLVCGCVNPLDEACGQCRRTRGESHDSVLRQFQTSSQAQCVPENPATHAEDRRLRVAILSRWYCLKCWNASPKQIVRFDQDNAVCVAHAHPYSSSEIGCENTA